MHLLIAYDCLRIFLLLLFIYFLFLYIYKAFNIAILQLS